MTWESYETIASFFPNDLLSHFAVRATRLRRWNGTIGLLAAEIVSKQGHGGETRKQTGCPVVFKVSQVINGLRLLWAEERKRKKNNHLCYFLCVKDWRLISAPPLQIGLRTGSIPACVCSENWSVAVPLWASTSWRNVSITACIFREWPCCLAHLNGWCVQR